MDYLPPPPCSSPRRGWCTNPLPPAKSAWNAPRVGSHGRVVGTPALEADAESLVIVTAAHYHQNPHPRRQCEAKIDIPAWKTCDLSMGQRLFCQAVFGAVEIDSAGARLCRERGGLAGPHKGFFEPLPKLGMYIA